MTNHPSRPAPLSPDGVSQAARSRSVQVLWFDGIHSKPWPTWAMLRPGPNGVSLSLHPMDGAASRLQLSPHQINWPEIWRKQNMPAPLIVDLGDHGTLEVHDVNAWQDALEAVGHVPTFAGRLQRSWRWLGITALSAVLLAGAFYRWGTPWAATQLTRFVPLGLEQRISSEYLAQLDAQVLRPSQIAATRQAELRQAFDALVQQIPPGLPQYRGYQPVYRLEFRRGMGPNAFALPGGTIVLTDEIIRHAQRQKLTDDALLGVLAHEIGHVANRHTSRAVLQQAVLQTGISLALGDLSSVVATGASALTSLSYSRAHEREADCFALHLMQAVNKPTQPMADLLLSLDPMDDVATGKPSTPASSPAAQAEPEPGSDWFATHPDTVARARMLRNGDSQMCK